MTPPSTATLPAPACAPARPQAGVPAAAPLLVQALTLAEPLPGFPGHRDYVLVPAEDGGRLFWLQSVAPDGPRFLAVPAGAYFPEYAPRLPAAACDELGLGDVADARLYCLVTVPDGDVASATANLRAPVVVNPATHQARQIVLLDGAHPLRRPLRR
ncbi:flagellar assembly protein FliW [Blastococcus tunisiensis]|uniref:Flagellar assembly factor FliW n=1 Tax=Blastococcus tunisiensis TaxID=1798228 RepID=A0A1I2KSK8_9ACTN|nr:flagellar assembly protein FliW [Blastococcus sp. DSM 46838]SFF69935.1 flagellar assembly factor FliW [Blastococcus sp. DSM 46838]